MSLNIVSLFPLFFFSKAWAVSTRVHLVGKCLLHGVRVHTVRFHTNKTCNCLFTSTTTMADDLISSLYPPPPPYYKYFTDEKLAKFEEWKQTESSDLPPGDLRLQIPPEVPLGDQYRGYGSIWALENKLPSLKDLGWRQLYNDHDESITSRQRIDELHKLLDSLLLNFLELVGIMSVEPAKFYTKIEDLKLILININHLLNTYRPHQTRESLIMLLKKQIESKRADIREIDKVSAEVKERVLALVLSDQILGLKQPDKDASMEGDADDERLRKLQRLRELLAQEET